MMMKALRNRKRYLAGQPLAGTLAVSLLMLLLAACTKAPPIHPAAPEDVDVEWAVFEGAWFNIRHPGDFKAVPSMPSPNGEPGFDSAFFVAADRRVEFYVLSPLWRRPALDIAFEPALESELDSSVVDGDTVTRTTRKIVANDQSYTRIVETLVSHDQAVSWSFQLRYADEAARSAHALDYQRFKRSLEQFAD